MNGWVELTRKTSRCGLSGKQQQCCQMQGLSNSGDTHRSMYKPATVTTAAAAAVAITTAV
jgi:hypothetical protein